MGSCKGGNGAKRPPSRRGFFITLTMLSLELSDGSKLKADVKLLGEPKALTVTQTRNSATGTQTGTISIPLPDLKRLTEAIGAIVKIFRG